MIFLDAENPSQPTAGQLSAAATRDGWTVLETTESDADASLPPIDGLPVTIRSHRVSFIGIRDGLRLQAWSSSVPGFPTQFTIHTSIDIAALEPAIVRPLISVGVLLGGVLGWLLVAALAQRSRGRRAPALLGAAALLTLVLPALAIDGNVIGLFQAPHSAGEGGYAVHAAFTPGEYYPWDPRWQVLGLSIAGGMLAVAALLLAYRRPAAVMAPEPAVRTD
jgi:hypothetical protein